MLNGPIAGGNLNRWLLKATVTCIFDFLLYLTDPAFCYINEGLARSYSHEDVSMMAQADLRLCCSHMAKTNFLTTRLIWIKHDLYALTSAGSCWKRESERRWFQNLPRGPADVNASENIIWSLLLHMQKHSETLGSMLRKMLPSSCHYAVKCFLSTFWKRHFQGEWQCHHDVTKLCLLPCTLLMLTSDFVTAPEYL